MRLFRQPLARYPAAALRLACAMLVALWALSTVPLPTPGGASLTKPAREHAVLAPKRPATAIAEVSRARPGNGKVWLPDHPGLPGAAPRLRVVATGIAAFDPGLAVPGRPRPANRARAPPLSVAA